MNEEQYQLGIRKMTPHEKVTMITVYRNIILEQCDNLRMIKQYLLDNPAQELWATQLIKELEEITSDYKVALKKGGIDNE